MGSSTRCRRRDQRFVLPEALGGRVEFGYPIPGEHRCAMPLRDISYAGVSFVLVHELPGLEVGRSLERASVRVGTHEIRGDLVVMHLTPDDTPGSVCGALLYPTGDRDIVKLDTLLAELDAGGLALTPGA